MIARAQLRLNLSKIYFHQIRRLYITSLQYKMRQPMENILLRIFTKETMVHSCRRKQRIFRCWWIVCIEQQVVSVYYMSPTHIWAWLDTIFIASFWCQKFWYNRKTVLEDNPTVTLSILFHSMSFGVEKHTTLM